jgi:hypothetical protein
MDSLDVVPVRIEQVRREVVGCVGAQARPTVVAVATIHSRLMELLHGSLRFGNHRQVDTISGNATHERQRAELNELATRRLLHTEWREDKSVERSARRQVGHRQLNVVEHAPLALRLERGEQVVDRDER